MSEANYRAWLRGKPEQPRRCPICGRPPRQERGKTVVFKVAAWARGEPHVAERLRCTAEPPHEWEVVEVLTR